MNYWQFFSRGMLGRNGKGWPWFVLAAAAAGTAGIHLYRWHSQLQHMQRELDALRARSKQSDLAVQKWIAQVQALEQKWLQFSAYFQGMMTMSTSLSIPQQQHRFASSMVPFPSSPGTAAAAVSAPETTGGSGGHLHTHPFPRLLRPVPQQPPMLAAAATSTALELYDDGASCKSQCGSQASDSPPLTPNMLLAAAPPASSSHPPTPSLQSSHHSHSYRNECIMSTSAAAAAAAHPEMPLSAAAMGAEAQHYRQPSFASSSFYDTADTAATRPATMSPPNDFVCIDAAAPHEPTTATTHRVPINQQWYTIYST